MYFRLQTYNQRARDFDVQYTVAYLQVVETKTGCCEIIKLNEYSDKLVARKHHIVLCQINNIPIFAEYRNKLVLTDCLHA